MILDVSDTDIRNIMRNLRRTEKYLASRMNEVQYAWEHRWAEHNILPHYFGRYCTGSIDTFPVYVQRPKNYWWQSKLYNGKYGSTSSFSPFSPFPQFPYFPQFHVV